MEEVRHKKITKMVSLGIHNIMDIFVRLQFLDNVKLHVGCLSAITVDKWTRKYVQNMMKEYNLQSDLDHTKGQGTKFYLVVK